MLLLLLLLTVSENHANDDIFLLPMISEGMDPGNQTFFEIEEDHERLCGIEGRLLKEKGNRLVQCSSDDECLPPSQCHTTGYCCMIALNQEPPPVGCPIGTRPLVNSSGMELTCSPSVPDSCPGGALCYTDSLTNAKRCCGTDPGQGCPSGSRVLLTSLEKPRLCVPGKANALCPRGALCQWSHLIDRYQCCEPDNGCPRHQAPLKKVDALKCNPRGAPCPDGAGCHFNFWTASYQCCKLDTTDLCPAGQVPILAESNGEPKSCRQSMDCPTSYHCAENNICCGSPGTCPENQQPAKDKFGRLTACTARNGNTCPTGSQCFPTGFFSQHLCCEQIEYTCPGYSTPYPSSRFPQKCDLGEPWRCGDKQCMPSNIPNVDICCQSTIVRQREVNPCPSGWAPNDNVVTYCTPSFQSSSCPGFSSCLRSTGVQQQFVCCVPSQ
uniref:CC domain-containing protein n=1 Tax=Haemonchus contortus TaxID=6289 RepID=A0A7I4Y5V0_HAECO